jgi:hypothetical protein
LTLYGIWAVVVALVLGFILATGGWDGGAMVFGLVLLVIPGAIFIVLRHGESLVSAKAARLGFRVRRISWNDASRLEPLFDREATRSHWNFDLLEGRHEGTDVIVYAMTSALRRSRGDGDLDKALGVVSSIPEGTFPRLVVHGSDTRTDLVPTRDGTDRESASRSTSPPLTPALPIPGFQERFSCFGESGAELLLTEAVQRVLLDLPRRSRLLVEGPRLRWETEVGQFSRGLGRRAEELLKRTTPLRVALSTLARRSVRESPTREYRDSRGA